MKKIIVSATLLLLALVAPAPGQQQGSAQEQGWTPKADAAGQVQIPLDVYNALMNAARDPSRLPRPAPAGYALGTARVTVTVPATEPRSAGTVRVDLVIDVFEDDWVLIPVLPAATAVESVTVEGAPVQLLATPGGLAWSTKKSGSYRMTLSYRVDATRSKGGFSLAVPLPEAAAMELVATLPGSDLDVSVIPSAGVRTEAAGSAATRINATVPSSSGVQIVWRAPVDSGHAVSRATYAGQLIGDAVSWTGTLEIELFSDETVPLHLLPQGVTLSEVQVDGESAAILVEGGFFTTPVRGRGRHQVTVGFQSPVVRGEGPPSIQVQVPEVPVSRFDLTLPGKKEVQVTPAANVTSRSRGDSTVATIFAPLTTKLSFSWAEAVPEDVRAEVRANVSLYHAAFAEEGVLNLRAFVLFEVTRGETNLLRLAVPPEVQVNRVTAPSGAVADWRMEEEEAGKPRVLSIFLDRKIRQELVIEVLYDRSIPSAEEGEPFVLPLLTAPDAHRQRGMVALLSSPQLTLVPADDGQATRVGENQLPVFVREALAMTVAHTFKYVEEPPRLLTQVTEPERKEGRFDAQVDTLVSLGEVTLGGSASVEINVKSGSIVALELRVPEGVNILHLTGPSIRSHHIAEQADGQRIAIEFTQEMEGQFRLELTYEKILGETAEGLAVPLLSAQGAEVEQGRVAVEALTAVEVRPVRSDQLTALDVAELPRQLLLRTTNPILLAYKYVQGDSPHELLLKVTRHDLLDVQEAAIDVAEYRTLFTRDGLAVTTAHFIVRNSSKQFLRVRLPADAEIWSAFVNGKPEKPALAAAGDSGAERAEGAAGAVLLKIVNSTEGFPVQLIYATRASKIRGLGKVQALLPVPEILVTRSRWDVYLPAEMRYGRPKGNMDLVAAGARVSAQEVQAEMARQLGDGAVQVMEPLRISVPTAGIHYAFEKLYANQAGQSSWLAIPYASATGARFGALLSVLGTLLFWGGLALAVRPLLSIRPRLALAGALLGSVLLLVTVGRYGVSAAPATTVTVLLVLLAGLLLLRRRWRSGEVVEAE